MENILYLSLELAVVILFFLAGRYILPNVPQTVVDKLALLSGWATQFVRWAKQFLQGSTGEEKMAAVVEKLKEIAEEAGLEVTEEQLRAIAQTAYDALKAGEQQAKREDKNVLSI